MDGRVFGKRGHSERIGEHVMKNIIGEKDQKIFESGVSYFKIGLSNRELTIVRNMLKVYCLYS